MTPASPAQTPSRAGSTPEPAPAATQFPRQGWDRIARRPEQVLLVCYYDPAGISTVPETVAFMQSASRYAVTVHNLFEHRVDTGYLKLHPWINLDAFRAVVIHNTVSYNVDNLRSLDAQLARKLRDFPGAKVLMKQDENFRFRGLAQYIGEASFDVVFTCLPPEALELVYPPELAGRPRFERMLTGYVTPTLRAIKPAVGPRPVDIGYRGSIQPMSFGWLAYEKRKIGDDVARLLAGQGLALDISSRWEDRFGGDAWFDFLKSCKATLGAESGASIFDLAGDLEQRCAELEQRHADLPTEPARAQAVLAGLADLEGNVDYAQISPRHFEAAACGTLQLLYPGTYSGLLTPGRHFFQLERDYSNLAEAVALLRDDARRQAMTDRAYEEVVLDPANWIESFVARVDDCIADVLAAKGVVPASVLPHVPSGHNVLLLAAHDPALDPRLGWIPEGAKAPTRIHQLGVLSPDAAEARIHAVPGGSHVLAYPRRPWQPEFGLRLLAKVAHSPAGMAGAQELLFLQHAVQLPEPEFCALFGAPPQKHRNSDFRWYLRYLLDTAATLLEQASAMRGIHAVIAADLDTLPAALVLKGLFGVPVLYDAHEYWPEQDVFGYEYEKEFWSGLERRLVAHADHRQTVSPGLAGLMSAQYGVAFDTVPNCEPVDRLLPLRERPARLDGSCHFVFQGIFAPARGIDLLIQAWPEVDARAILQLRGPDGACKSEMMALAAGTGLLGTRILFPDPVEESRLIAAAAEADVGLIPYTPMGTNYRNCCPNKMSQYMAAGLPILANATTFVAPTVAGAGCGAVVDFGRRGQLLGAVADLCASSERRNALGQAGREYFRRGFNWNAVSAGMYAWLEQAMHGRSEEPLARYVCDLQPKLVQQTAAAAIAADEAHVASAPADAGIQAVPHAPQAVAAQDAAPVPQPASASPATARYQAALALWRLLPLPLRRALQPVARRLAARFGA